MARKKATATPSIPPLSYEEQQALVVGKFLDGDGWDSIYRTWKERMEDFAVPLDPLFMDVPILDTTGNYEREDHPDWWHHQNIARHRDEVLNQIKLGRVIYPFVDPDFHLTKSIGQTVRHLWKHRGDPEIVAAIMIAGSIFLRTGGRRGGRLPEDWPDYQCVKAVEALANARWDGNEYGPGWMHVMSDPFPGNQPDDEEYGIKSLRGLVQYFAVEHAATLLLYRLVNVRLVGAEQPKLQLV